MLPQIVTILMERLLGIDGSTLNMIFSVIWYWMSLWQLCGWHFLRISEQMLSWMMDEFIDWPKPCLLLSATCGWMLSWMIKLWMKNSLRKRQWLQHYKSIISPKKLQGTTKNVGLRISVDDLQLVESKIIGIGDNKISHLVYWWSYNVNLYWRVCVGFTVGLLGSYTRKLKLGTIWILDFLVDWILLVTPPHAMFTIHSSPKNCSNIIKI